MDLYLRRYILYHGFAIGFGAFVVSILTIYLYVKEDVHVYFSQLSFYTWVYWIGTWAWLLGALWILAGASFLFGILKKRKSALLPLLFLLGIHLLAVLFGDVLLVLDLSYMNWNFSPFLNVSQFASIIYVILHVGFTIVVLGKLIDEDSRKSNWTGTSLQVCGQPTTVSDESEFVVIS
ncbi:uncharacterized protein LOC110675608 [Aedes aegypti]|uniref:Uncharacterized protein n=1 Tax=Aedes aegypti TaxID=7159 RepID=A0A6I8U4B7_AEDAE|nr:uncharacterized protein LOC110675608 [Aedes aegypti]